MKKLAYLATPYSKYPLGRSKAFYEASHKAAELMHSQDEYAIFSPIVHSHTIETESFLNVEAGPFWMAQDLPVLAKCDKLFVYRMSGWQDSIGVNEEIAFANERGILVEYVD